MAAGPLHLFRFSVQVIHHYHMCVLNCFLASNFGHNSFCFVHYFQPSSLPVAFLLFLPFSDVRVFINLWPEGRKPARQVSTQPRHIKTTIMQLPMFMVTLDCNLHRCDKSLHYVTTYFSRPKRILQQ